MRKMTPPRAVWGPAAVFFIVASITVAIWHFTQRHDQETLRLKTDLTADQLAPRLQEFVGVRLKIVQHFQELWRRGQLNDPGQFRDYALYVEARFPGLQAINYVDPEGFIRWVVPEGPNRAAKDRDLKQHPEAAETFLAVMKTGDMRITPPIHLMQGGEGLAAYFPLNRDGRVEGFLNAVFRTDALVTACLGEAIWSNFAIELRDGGQVAFVRGPIGADAGVPRAERAITILDRTWVLAIVPTPALIAASGSWIDKAAFFTGFALAAGLALLLRRLQLREAALIDSRGRYQTIFENAQVGLVQIHDTEGRLLEANLAAAELCGYATREEFIRDYVTIPNWLNPDDRIRMYDGLQKGGGRIDSFEARFKRKDGTPLWIRCSVRHVKEKGYIEAVLVGIDEEKKALQGLLASEQRFRSLAESTSAAILIIRGEQIIYANPAALTQLGYAWERMRGVHPNTLLAPASAAALEQYGADWMAGRPVPPSLELQAVAADGKHRWIEMTVGPLEMDGEIAIVTTSFDITERKLAEEARRAAEEQMFRAEKMAALGQIIAGVAHEINNPNNFIYFNLPILRRYLEAIRPHLDECAAGKPGLTILNMPYDAFMADTFKLLENMQHGSSRITEIVAELKDYIRSHEAGEKKPEGLGRIIDRVMTLVGKQVRKTVKTFEVEVAPDLPPVLVHAGRIEQVLINMLINAGQAADKDDSRVSLRAAPSALHPRRVEVVIEDNGCGIAQADLDRIFDPFFTTKGRDAGTGLGLAISHRIIEEHGGAIHVESEPGRGARFIVELPVAAEAAA